MIRTIRNPAIYHGHGKEPPFFEGWYYKLVSADEAHKYAIIPGVYLGADGYAFIQVLDGNTGVVAFLKFPLEAFTAPKDDFNLQIDRNIFRLAQVRLDLDRPGIRIKGDLAFSGVVGWPITWTSPGVMGWYAWVPKMECNHGVLSFDHTITGRLVVNDSEIDFSNGRGYIEKDWGAAFPEGYIWAQSNHFNHPGVCLTASIAIIPWLWRAFRGFIVGLWIDGKLYRFATYTGAVTNLLEVRDKEVIWIMSDRHHRLEINAVRGRTGDLKGPTRQDMGMRVAESLQAVIHLKLSTAGGKVLYEDSGRHAGLEIAGNINRLVNFD